MGREDAEQNEAQQVVGKGPASCLQRDEAGEAVLRPGNLSLESLPSQAVQAEQARGGASRDVIADEEEDIDEHRQAKDDASGAQSCQKSASVNGIIKLVFQLTGRQTHIQSFSLWAP